MQDILFQTPENVFSYRVGGILLHEGKILLQRLMDGEGYAIPGGHVSFGETTQETIVREFREETGAEIIVDRPVFLGEIYIPWGTKACHQVCMYYLVSLKNPGQLPMEGEFPVVDDFDNQRIRLDFCWKSEKELSSLVVYPTTIQPLLFNPPEGITHFVYREE